jgi:uncharacterized protein
MTTTTDSFAPVAKTERIASIDVVRGVALLGILLMNVTGFALYRGYYDPTNAGGATGLDLAAWAINNLLFEGTMRGLFSMLFGAGIVLFLSRSGGNLLVVTDAYFRRILWLFLFGIIHAYLLLWFGEILYPYALIGLFAYSFRNLAPNRLIACSLVLSLCLTALNVKEYVQTGYAYRHYTAATAKQRAGAQLTKPERKALIDWEAIVASKKATPERAAEAKAELSKGYFSIVWYRATTVQTLQTTIMYRQFFWDIFGMMLLGMAFLKLGIFSAARSTGFYGRMVLFGYAVGLTTNYWETAYLIDHQFDVRAFFLTDVTHELGRIPTTIGHIGLIMLFIRSGWLVGLRNALGAVGQMAFTNYILHTLICTTLFMGFGFGLFNELRRHELYYVVFAIWLFQLIISPLWLRYFRFGPLEWAWRSLTYWQRQPFRKTTRPTLIEA